MSATYISEQYNNDILQTNILHLPSPIIYVSEFILFHLQKQNSG